VGEGGRSSGGNARNTLVKGAVFAMAVFSSAWVQPCDRGQARNRDCPTAGDDPRGITSAIDIGKLDREELQCMVGWEIARTP
jgi:hypothetical protein